MDGLLVCKTDAPPKPSKRVETLYDVVSNHPPSFFQWTMDAVVTKCGECFSGQSVQSDSVARP